MTITIGNTAASIMPTNATATSSSSSSSSTGGVVCFGHPLLDMMASVDADFLTQHSVSLGSVTLASPSQVVLFEQLARRAEAVEYVTGGAAMNTARFLKWLRPRTRVSYVGALGADAFAHELRERLAHSGVDGLFEVHMGKPTGTCAGLVCAKERTLIANLGAAVELTLQHVLGDDVQRAIAGASLYYVEGFFFNTVSSPDNLLYVAIHARECDKLLCLNLNAPYVCSSYQDHLAMLLPYVDILFGNDDDMLAFAAARWPECFGDKVAAAAAVTTTTTATGGAASNSDTNKNSKDDDAADDKDGAPPDAATQRRHSTTGSSVRTRRLEAAALCIANLPSLKHHRPRLVVVTRGAASTLVASEQAVRHYAVPPMAHTDVVDFNGAGDAFVAGFLAQYMSSGDEARSADVGHATAQNCIRHQGARFSGDPPHVCDEASVATAAATATRTEASVGPVAVTLASSIALPGVSDAVLRNALAC